MLRPICARAGCLVLIFAGAVACAAGGKPSVVTYEFTVTFAAGPLRGVDTGAISYMSTSITPLHTNHATDVLTRLDFTLNGITYSARSANTGELSFGPAGELLLNHGPLFGTDCQSNACRVVPGGDGWFADGRHFFYTTRGSSRMGVGTVSYRVVKSPSL